MMLWMLFGIKQWKIEIYAATLWQFKYIWIEPVGVAALFAMDLLIIIIIVGQLEQNKWLNKTYANSSYER